MDIAALIRSTKGDRTYEQLATDCGEEPTRQRLWQIATGAQKEFPKPATIRGLAHGLHVSQRTVVLAWAESVGLDASTNDTRLAQLLPPSAANLTDDQIAAVLATVRSMTTKGRGSGALSTATTKAAGGDMVTGESASYSEETQPEASQPTGQQDPAQAQP